MLATIARRVAVSARVSGSRSYAAGGRMLDDLLIAEASAIHEAGTWKTENIITSKQGATVAVADSHDDALMFCSNNYLGLASHPRVTEAAKDAIDTHGAGLASVRFICGSCDIHKELEDKITAFHRTEDTILYPSCFDANAGLFEVILNKSDAIISDELNHASIIDGVRLCKARRERYNHRNMADLEAKLQATQDCRLRLIATDGVFSMDGTIAPLKEICDLADKYNAIVFVDECHATGFMGKTGRGVPELLGVEGRVDIINSTLGKALGGASGGYTTGSKALVDMLRNKARPYLFSNTLAPPVVGAANAVFDMLMESTELRDRVTANTARFRQKMTEAGFQVGGDNHPISPILLNDEKLTHQFALRMREEGCFVIGFSYPVVGKGKARIRTQISAAHTDEQIDRAVAIFTKVAKELNFL